MMDFKTSHRAPAVCCRAAENYKVEMKRKLNLNIKQRVVNKIVLRNLWRGSWPVPDLFVSNFQTVQV